jgi:transcriptional regulator with XRE-family HTH domain
MPEIRLTEIIGKNINERRRRLGLSQKELATRLGVTQDAMARMERGLIAPKMSRLPCLAEALRCTVTYLFRQHDEATDDLAATMADILMSVPTEGREALVELLVHAASVMKRG